MSSGIYEVRVNNRVYYGRSINLERRNRRHFYELKKGNHANTVLQRSFNKHRDYNFKTLVLTESIDLQIELEQYLLDTLPCCNLSPNSKSGNLPGEKHLLYGKNLSEDTKEKISSKLRGELHPFFGKKHKDSTKKLISERNKGEKNGRYSGLKYKFYHEDYGEIICTSLALRINFELSKSGISGIVTGSRKTHKGWKCYGQI